MSDNETKNAESTNVAPQAGSAEAILAKEVNELEDILTQKMLPREKSLQVGYKIRIGLAIFALCYCAFLYSLAYSFDAKEAVMMVQAQLDNQLPALKQEAVENMKKAAPEVVEGYAKNMVSSIPSMRMNLQQELLQTTNENINNIENSVNDMCTELLNQSKAEFDKMGDKMTTAEKIERLGQELKIKIFEDGREIVDGIAEEYMGKIHEVTKEIKRLQTSPNLTIKEKHQKELLRISSKLMQMKLKDVNADFQKATEELSKQSDIVAE